MKTPTVLILIHNIRKKIGKEKKQPQEELHEINTIELINHKMYFSVIYWCSLKSDKDFPAELNINTNENGFH